MLRKSKVIDSVFREIGIGFGDTSKGEWHIGKVEGTRDEGTLIVKTLLLIGISFDGMYPRPVFEVLDLYFASTKTGNERVVWRSSDYGGLGEAKKRRSKNLKRFLRSVGASQDCIERGFASLRGGRTFNFSLGQFRLFRERKKNHEGNRTLSTLLSPDDDKTRQLTAMHRMQDSMRKKEETPDISAKKKHVL